jgi:hypothetical protein
MCHTFDVPMGWVKEKQMRGDEAQALFSFPSCYVIAIRLATAKR